MGLCATAKGLTAETEFDCGYLTYGRFLRNLAYAYNDEIGEMFESMCNGNRLAEQQENRWNKICNDDLDLLLFHSDCDGKFTPQECRRIYNAIKDFHMDAQEELAREVWVGIRPDQLRHHHGGKHSAIWGLTRM